MHKLKWVDGLKGIAIAGVVLENWTRAVSYDAGQGLLGRLPGLAAYGGTLVHIFFLLSGFGLARSCLLRPPHGWRDWAFRRFAKIIIPYWIAISVTYGAAVLLHQLLPDRYPQSYSLSTLLAYLTLMRNAVPSAWSLNSSYWFIPVIAGLYLVFPLLMTALRRWGAVRFAVLAMGLSYASIVVAWAAGCPDHHQAALFLFHLPQFAIGMLLADAVTQGKLNLSCFRGWRAFFAGVALYASSYLLVNCAHWGSRVNDPFTVAGAMLMGFAALHWLDRPGLTFIPGALAALGRKSYIIYLVHMPIMTLAAAPFIEDTASGKAHAGVLFLLQVVSIPLLLVLAKAVAGIVEAIRPATDM